jgi:NADPH:quinone reductase-like Zn-dependent oxidoreductase
MKAVFLTKKNSASKSFEIREIEMPKPDDNSVLIKVSAFGLNYADVMARLGLYPEMPPMPCVLGYDVCGEILEVGKDVKNLKIGDHVVALTRFGGYAEYAVADQRVCISVESSIPSHKKLAMATQLSTSYNAAIECVNMHEGDVVLIQAAAGGVGLGIVQIALEKKCTIIAVASKDEKLDFLKSLGVQHTINYKKKDIIQALRDMGFYHKIDFIFDSVGGDYVKKGMRALNSGGKYILFGASKLSGPKNKIGVIFEALKFGLAFFSPPQFLMPSKSLIGINMLAIADSKPEFIARCMHGVYDLYQKGILTHIEGESYSIDQLAEAHDKLENGQTIGKIAIEWQDFIKK